MTRQEINKMVIDTLEEAFDLSAEDLVPTAKLYEDLDLDSLDAIDLAVKLKNDVGVTLDEGEMRSLIELSDLIDLLEKKINMSHPDVT
jgi:acyl carrier protein